MVEMKEEVRKTYDKSMKTFGKFKRIDNDYTDLIKKNVNQDSMLLDIGCGGGRLTTSINEYVKKIIGIDYSHNLIKYAKRFNSRRNIIYKFMDGEKLNFPRNTFDSIVSHAVINKLMCKANSTFKSAYKILKPEGKIIVKMIYSTWGKEFGFKGGYNAKEIRAILQNTGFKNIKISIQKQHFKGKSIDSMKWIEDTEANNIVSKTEFDKFYKKCEKAKNYSFDDSFMIVYAKK